MNFTRNFSIKSKLIFLLALFIVPLTYFIYNSVDREFKTLGRYSALTEHIHRAEKISIFIHELQKERALSHIYLGNRGRKFVQELEIQRKVVDGIYNNLPESTLNNLKTVSMLNNLPENRQKIDNLHMEEMVLGTYYTQLIAQLIDDFEHSLTAMEEPSMRIELNSNMNLMNSKERLGLLRAAVNRSLVTGIFSSSDFGLFASSKGAYDIFTEAFVNESPAEIISYYSETLSTQNWEVVENVINSIMASGTMEDLGLTQQQWHDHASQTIDQLHQVQNFLLAYSLSEVQDQMRAKRALIVVYIASLLSLLILALSFSTYLVRNLVSSLGNLQRAAEKIAHGDTDVEVKIHSNDEIGFLARSFNALIDNTKQLSHVAEEIGAGNYDVDVNIRGNVDILGLSLEKMKISLKQLSDSEKEKNWLLSGSGALNDLMRGEKDPATLSVKILTHLGKYLGLPLGALYINNEYDKLELSGTYGFVPEATQKSVLDIGEGLAGQVAANREMLYIQNIPERYWDIHSGTVSGKPKDLILYPLFYENNLIGVLELASFGEMTDLQLRYIDNQLERIAIYISNLRAELKTQELLYQTQNQAEEMETQQEELRQINDELKEQSNRLQSSEEELKVNQEELQEKNAELEEKANQLEEQYEAINLKNRELEELKEVLQLKIDQLEVTGKYKSEFLANMSHELRTPLNSILILARILSENKNENLNDKQVEFCNIIQKSGKELLSLINDILDLAKIESGKVSLEFVNITLSEVISATQYKELAKDKKIKFRQELDKKLPEKIRSDSFRLQQIIKNLLSNAFKFTEEGGEVVLKIYPAPADIRYSNLNLRTQKDVIAFEVMDTGIGIPEDKQKLIFEAFQQVDASTSRKYGGTGLGLSISKELAHLLGGEITLKSELHKGSSFILYLPLSPSEESIKEKVSESVFAASEKALSSIKKEERAVPEQSVPTVKESAEPKASFQSSDRIILIIEDDESFASILNDFAKARNYKTLIANDGLTGFQYIREYKPDAIILDMNLPGMSGWEIMKELKADDDFRKIPVHIMSATDKESLGKSLDGIDYVQKPVSVETIKDIFTKISEETEKPLKKILIVEDNTIQNLSIKELLSSKGMPAESVFSGEEAYKLLKEKKFDTVILDLNLPDINGFDLLEKCKAIDKLKPVPFIVYSGRDLTEGEVKRLKKHTSAIIVKTAESYTRLLDEIGLFLHNVNDRLPKEKERQFKLHKSEETLLGKKVLLVDDDIRNVYALYNVLEEQSMEILTASNGIEALDMLKEHPDTNIVLMDIMMPEMDGYEATRQIRKQNQFKNLPVIAITAKAMKGDKEKCIQAGASDYISKPVDIDKLLSLMKVWLYDSARKVL